jgi:hypothetical protein
LPITALFAKIIPPNIEGTAYALLSGTQDFTSFIIAPLLGVMINNHSAQVDAINLHHFSRLTLIGFICSFSGFLFLKFIPSQNDIIRF